MKMAAMAQVLRAQRVWSIQVENDTNLFGNTFENKTKKLHKHPITAEVVNMTCSDSKWAERSMERPVNQSQCACVQLSPAAAACTVIVETIDLIHSNMLFKINSFFS